MIPAVKFITPLTLLALKDGEWELTSDFVVEIDGVELLVPSAFYTDLASIPPPVSWWLKPDGRYKESAVIHDFKLYQLKHRIIKASRASLSLIFLGSLIHQKIAWYKIAILYTGVSLKDGYKFLGSML